jgi:hypothetical protein
MLHFPSARYQFTARLSLAHTSVWPDGQRSVRELYNRGGTISAASLVLTIVCSLAREGKFVWMYALASVLSLWVASTEPAPWPHLVAHWVVRLWAAVTCKGQFKNLKATTEHFVWAICTPYESRAGVCYSGPVFLGPSREMLD